MFDPNNDSFKPIIGARLIRDEAKKQTEKLVKPEDPLEPQGDIVKETLDIDISRPPEIFQRSETVVNISPKGGNKERG
ncbi:MAG: hypothetical protein HYW86_04220 [Candidatus Roizmanbacteria bacterium]|nr:MAG: hypothetical protein HYW86_04220 [Candidatus Roizmanbacteria bacterium]